MYEWYLNDTRGNSSLFSICKLVLEQNSEAFLYFKGSASTHIPLRNMPIIPGQGKICVLSDALARPQSLLLESHLHKVGLQWVKVVVCQVLDCNENSYNNMYWMNHFFSDWLSKRMWQIIFDLCKIIIKTYPK